MNHTAPTKNAGGARGARGTRIQVFGPGRRLAGLTTEAAAEKSGTGAVLWGMGIAQLRLARQLARLGIPSLQAKLLRRNDSQRHFSHDGIALVRAAMDRLAAQQGVDSFMLMGNCAFANICLNTAFADTRISMLMLTNPYLSKQQEHEMKRWSLIARRVFSFERWMRLLAGKVQVRSNLDSLQSLLSGIRDSDRANVTATNKRKQSLGKEMILSPDLDEKLLALSDRGVQIYCACSATELGLRYLRKHYSKTLKELQRRGKLELKMIDTDAHLMGTNTEGALMHSKAIGEWLSRSVHSN